jgi:hypothetical protein
MLSDYRGALIDRGQLLEDERERQPVVPPIAPPQRLDEGGLLPPKTTW